MIRPATFCAALAAAFLSCASVGSAQTTARRQNRIRLETDVVTVPATVLDASGKPVADLPESAFKLYENDV